MNIWNWNLKKFVNSQRQRFTKIKTVRAHAHTLTRHKEKLKFVWQYFQTS